MNTAEVFRRCSRLAAAGAWCRGTMARDRQGNSTFIKSPDAVSWCAVGMIKNITGEVDISDKEIRCLKDAAKDVGAGYRATIADINDLVIRDSGHAAQWFEAAAKRAEEANKTNQS